MPDIDRHEPGTFCWAELGTTSTAAAKQFYGGLFGWTFFDMPMGPGRVYSICLLNGRDTGALYDIDPQGPAKPGWTSYIAGDPDRAADLARSNGGSVAAGPFDVSEAGRSVVLADPEGAVFGVWKANQHPGFRVVNEPGTMAWPELATRGTARARSFYSALFGWGAKDSPQYTEWQNGGRSIGGMMDISAPMWEGIPTHWMHYFLTRDCDDSAKRAESSGARIQVPPRDIPGVGRFSVIFDPQGAPFSLIQLSHQVAAG